MGPSKESALSQLIVTLGHLTTTISAKLLVYARAVLCGQVVPIPDKAMYVLRTGLDFGVFWTTLSPRGTIAVSGKKTGDEDAMIYLLRADNDSVVFYEDDAAIQISEVSFPQGSDDLAYKVGAPDYGDTWIWGQARFVSTGIHSDKPVYWHNRHGLACCALLDSPEVIVSDENRTHVLRCESEIPGVEHPRPVYIQAINGSLLVVWGRKTNSGNILGKIIWKTHESPVGEMNPHSITEGPDGKPWFLMTVNEFETPRLCNLDTGEMNPLDHHPKKVWAHKGCIYTLEVKHFDDNRQHPRCRIHEVISGWCSNWIVGSDVNYVWPAKSNRHELFFSELDHSVGHFWFSAMLANGEVDKRIMDVDTGDDPDSSLEVPHITRLGDVFVLHYADYHTYSFFVDHEEGQVLEFYHECPDHGTALQTLVLMDDGSIQAVKKLDGGQIVRYKFYEPEV